MVIAIRKKNKKQISSRGIESRVMRDQVTKFNRVVGTSFQSKDLKVRDLDEGATYRKSVPGTGNSESRGPEAEVCLVSLRKRKEAGVVRVEQAMEREER